MAFWHQAFDSAILYGISGFQFDRCSAARTPKATLVTSQP